jgi:hypothetical protein
MTAEIPISHQSFALAYEDLACYAIAQWPSFALARHHELIVAKLAWIIHDFTGGKRKGALKD